MTEMECEKILASLRQGHEFRTRFQEDSWGFFLEGNVVQYWKESQQDDGQINRTSEEWSVERLKSLLTGYSYANIFPYLRPR